MGVYDRDILDYVDSKENDCCQVDEVIDYLKDSPDFSSERIINDMYNLIKDGLLDYDKESNAVTLLPKAKRPLSPMPQDPRRNNE